MLVVPLLYCPGVLSISSNKGSIRLLSPDRPFWCLTSMNLYVGDGILESIFVSTGSGISLVDIFIGEEGTILVLPMPCLPLLLYFNVSHGGIVRSLTASVGHCHHLQSGLIGQECPSLFGLGQTCLIRNPKNRTTPHNSVCDAIPLVFCVVRTHKIWALRLMHHDNLNQIIHDVRVNWP